MHADRGVSMKEYTGNDNYGKPKSEYVGEVQKMTDAELEKECESKIWLSTFANNNPRSDNHWHVDVLYDECQDRGKLDIYKKAYEAVKASV
jgi:hypothetical protein